ncbi:hypothetical protein [Paenibacillus sp. IHBB 3054]|uniref:hypothetical protein n=1 Tax=Paenibacillus sp. IHBB 3054 TaxID=3425689 RepID=UPI003F6700DC
MDEQIMKLPVGTQIEEKIVSAMWDISGVQQPRMAYSRDALAALGLRDFAADAFGIVCLIKCGDGPAFISEMCIIQDEEDHRVEGLLRIGRSP